MHTAKETSLEQSLTKDIFSSLPESQKNRFIYNIQGTMPGLLRKRFFLLYNANLFRFITEMVTPITMIEGTPIAIAMATGQYLSPSDWLGSSESVSAAVVGLSASVEFVRNVFWLILAVEAMFVE